MNLPGQPARGLDQPAPGRDAAFRTFYQEVWQELSGYGVSLVGADGPDLAQEAMTRVYVRFRYLHEPRAYAYQIVTNLARRRWAHERRELDGWISRRAKVNSEPEFDHELLDAVRRLRSIHRDVLLLHYWGDLSVADIARAVRRPEGTVKRRLHDARRELSAALEER